MILLPLVAACSEYDVKKHPPEVSAELDVPAIAVDPPAVAFGALAPGAEATQTFTVSNVGLEPLQVAHMAIVGTSAFTLVETETAVSLAPDAAAPFTLAFTPANPADEGTLVIDSDDPARPTVEVPLTGAAFAPILEFSPNPADFGTVPLGCSLTMPITLHNGGEAPLVVTAIGESGDGWTVALPFDLPLTLAPDEVADVDVTYAPPTTDETTGGLYVTSNDLAGLRTATQWGAGGGDGVYEDDFVQDDGPWDATDILLYVDQSCSMDDDQVNLSENFDAFAEALDAVSLDWQLIVVTADDGCHNGGIFDAASVNASDMLDVVRGPNGSYTEAGLTIALNALEASGGGDCNDGFLREGSKTTVILVSDEAEQSPARPDDMVALMEEVAPTVTIHAIAGDMPFGCASADAGVGYDEAVAVTGGAFESICAPDWGAHFSEIADLAASGQRGTFPLSNWPDPSTLTVTVEGEPAEGWTWDSAENAIVFTDGAWPPARSHIVIHYADDADCEG